VKDDDAAVVSKVFDSLTYESASEYLANIIIWASVEATPFTPVDSKYLDACQSTTRINTLDTLMRYYKHAADDVKAKTFAQKFVDHYKSRDVFFAMDKAEAYRIL